jgi:hypothetical protein
MMATGSGFFTMLYVMSGTLWCSHTWLFTEVTSKVLVHLGGVCRVHIVAYGVIFIYIYIYILFICFCFAVGFMDTLMLPQ